MVDDMNTPPKPIPGSDRSGDPLDANQNGVFDSIEEAEAETPGSLTQTERLMTFSSTDDKYTWFKEREPDKILSLVAIERETYDEFGHPDTLTVTIRPGDHLNADD